MTNYNIAITVSDFSLLFCFLFFMLFLNTWLFFVGVGPGRKRKKKKKNFLEERFLKTWAEFFFLNLSSAQVRRHSLNTPTFSSFVVSTDFGAMKPDGVCLELWSLGAGVADLKPPPREDELHSDPDPHLDPSHPWCSRCWLWQATSVVCGRELFFLFFAAGEKPACKTKSVHVCMFTPSLTHTRFLSLSLSLLLPLKFGRPALCSLWNHKHSSVAS